MTQLMGITWNSMSDIEVLHSWYLVAVKMASNGNQAIYHITIKTSSTLKIFLAGLLICD